MPIFVDHYILKVTNIPASLAFYQRILGFTPEGTDGPFTVLRVSDSFTIQLAPWGTKGGEHLAFALSVADFEAAFARIREDAIPFGATYDTVGSGGGPGDELGARGMGKTVYFFDPDRHLLEIRHYED